MWERMFDLVLGLKKEHRLMMVITLIYAVTLFCITVDVEAMENWLQLVGYTIRTLCIACIIQLSVAHPTNPVEGCADANPKTELPNDT